MNEKEQVEKLSDLIGAEIIGFHTNAEGDVTWEDELIVEKNGKRYRITTSSPEDLDDFPDELPPIALFVEDFEAKDYDDIECDAEEELN